MDANDKSLGDLVLCLAFLQEAVPESPFSRPQITTLCRPAVTVPKPPHFLSDKLDHEGMDTR